MTIDLKSTMAAVIPAFSIVPSNVTATPLPLPVHLSPVSINSSTPLVVPHPTSHLTASSTHDTDILTYLLTPSLQHGPVVRSNDVTDEELGGPGPSISEATHTTLRKMQSEGIRAADDERYEDAVRLFSEVLTVCDHYAPAYNNRAQCYLLLHRDTDALADLHSSIQHAHTDRLTLRQSLTQRGMLYRRQGLDAEARADFGLGARLGSGVCREQLVVMNPYAAMCNAMLTRAMAELQEGREDGAGGGRSVQCTLSKAV